MESTALVSHVRQISRQLVDFILPPTCGVCQAMVDLPGALCAGCWRQLNFISAPICDSCGVPFDLPAAPGALCARCLTEPPVFTKARSALVYDDVSRKLIGHFKYGDQLHLLPTLLPWLARAAHDLIPDVDVIVPVPLHRRRLWKRRYNQAGLLARALGKEFNLPVEQTMLMRSRPTQQQVGMTREQREKNVKGAFTATIAAKEKNILLIDDVYTTGATLEACTKALLEAGAASVRVLTLARVVRPDQLY